MANLVANLGTAQRKLAIEQMHGAAIDRRLGAPEPNPVVGE
jgi:hypothetical protein